MAIKPLTESLGAEITGVDMACDPDRHGAELRDALLEHSVVVVRDQNLTEDQIVRLTRGMGPVEPYESTVKDFLMPGHPEVIVLSNILKDGKPIGIREAGQYWHTDRSYVPQPAWSSMLHAIKLPVDDKGVTRGNTQFASTIAAFKALPSAQQDRLRKLKAVHRYIYRYTRTPENPLPDAIHPVALPHPYTGRESLYVNSGFTAHLVGMSEQESQALLEELYAHIAQPRFVYTHHWRPGDLVMWDNFATQHNAIGDYALPLERLMWRTTVRAPAAAS